MRRMSSLSSKLVIFVVPFASVASNKIRFERLLEPGIWISPLALERGPSVIEFIIKSITVVVFIVLVLC